jgi:tetratricopeptide (TPR) repeat protein
VLSNLFNQKPLAKIKDKLEDILEALYPKFYKLHSKCLQKHSSAHIEQEVRLMKLLVRDLTAFEEKMSVGMNFTHLIDQKSGIVMSNDHMHEDYPLIEVESKDFQLHTPDLYQEIECSVDTNSHAIPFSAHSEVLLEQGSILNEFLLYKGAIKVLTNALKYNPSNRNAYIERAMAYFETNQINLALKDYKKAVELTNIPLIKTDKMMIDISSKIEIHQMLIYIPEQKKEFAKGLVAGILDGARISGEEFIPSVFDCCRGILCGLWAFALSPVDVSHEMINATYAIGEYVAYHSTKECLECVVPELRELSFEWEKINDRVRGKKIGYIIGKYGLDVFGPLVALKGINTIRAIKRANTMSTLQGCAVSQAERKKILEESVKRSILRETAISEALDNGKILVNNFNTQIHIMQPKHHWHKLVEITGNVEVDCKKVIKLLEENQMFLKDLNLKIVDDKLPKGMIRYRQKKKINGYTVIADFFENKELEEVFLNNAWVEK